MNVFQRFDAGALASKEPPKKRHDCQVRALCSALGVIYETAWTMLYVMQGERRACSFSLVNELQDRHPSLHVVRQLDFPAVKGKPRMTPQAFASAHPRGRFILKMAHHVACMKDGKLLDTWDSSRRCVYTAWEIDPKKNGES